MRLKNISIYNIFSLSTVSVTIFQKLFLRRTTRTNYKIDLCSGSEEHMCAQTDIYLRRVVNDILAYTGVRIQLTTRSKKKHLKRFFLLLFFNG